MANSIVHEDTEFQYSKRTGLYFPKDLRRKVDPSLTEKASDAIRTPVIIGLTALTLAGTVAPRVSGADNVSVENIIQGDEDKDINFQRTRTKLNLGSTTLTYDQNKGQNPDEGKLWINALSRNGWAAGILVQGQTDNNKDSYADLGVCVSKTLEDKTYEAFIGPTVQPGVKPAIFYQFSVRDTSGQENLVLSFVDDRALPFALKSLNFRGYASVQIGNTFGGIGTRQIGSDITRYYGGFGFNNQEIGSFGVFRYFPHDKKGKFKIQTGFTKPTGAIGLANVNIWNDMEGPGIRDVGTPYFTSFLTKGELTSVIEGNFFSGCKDYEIMVGKDFEIIRVGAGVNYHNENGNTNYGGLIHAVKTVKLGELGDLFIEGKYNTRDNNTQLFTRFQKEF